MRKTPQEFVTKARELISQMTLEEKVYQTLHGAPAIDRLGIKAYNWWNEALHGVARAGTATVFPQAISMAASFDEELLQEIAEVIAIEGRAKFNVQQKFDDTDIYKGLTFWSPNVNIFRDPRWGRGHETYGEDPYLTSRLGVRFVKGLQGEDETYLKVAACAKHFAVHSGPEDVRHEFNAVASEQDLRETYLPAFEACVREAGVEVVMGAYNRTNGEPCCGSKTLLKDILRDEWGFDGHVTSDCWAIKDFHEGHGVTDTPVESVALAMNNGCDLNCGNIYGNLIKAVQDGLVKEETLDKAVERLLITKFRLGIFDDPAKDPYAKYDYTYVDCKEHKAVNLKASEKCLVLLKNENNMLPLDKSKIKTIGVIGPNADNRKALVGNYEGTASEYVTVLEGIREYVGDDVRVLFSEGCHLFKNKVQGLGCENDRLSEVKAIAECSDVLVGVFGLDPGLEGEEGDQGNEFASGDKPNLNLPGLQSDIIKAMYETGKPVVLLLLSGSALAFPWEAEHIPAIMQCWYPGAQGGRAIAKALFGEISPEGKLPVTFYRTSEELPPFTDYAMKNRTYRYMEKEALYPFGYGLSYNDYSLSNVSLSQDTIDVEDKLVCKVTITNHGKYASAETIQAYVKAPQNLNEEKITQIPHCSLKALKKVSLQPGESKEVELELSCLDFALFDEDGIQCVVDGEFSLFVGFGQPDARTEALSGKKAIELKVNIAAKSLED